MTEPFERVAACHCESCKKLSGGGGTVSGRVRTDAIRLLAGEDLVEELPARRGLGEDLLLRVRLEPVRRRLARRRSTRAFGCPRSRSPTRAEIESHIFVRSLAPWEVLPDDGAERYDVRAP